MCKQAQPLFLKWLERVCAVWLRSSSIANLALKVADERAMQNDGNTFLEPKAEQLALAKLDPRAPGVVQAKPKKKATGQLSVNAATAAALRVGGAGGGLMGVIQQALAAEGGGAGGEGGGQELVYDKEGRRRVPTAYEESGFPEAPSASKSWNDAMALWQVNEL